MSDEANFQISISGKAVYRAVKNLLENDKEFQAKVSEQVSRVMENHDLVVAVVREQVNAVIQSTDLQKQIDAIVSDSIQRQLPSIARSKIDSIMKDSMMDVYRRLMSKGGK